MAALGLGIFVLWGSNYAIAQYFQLVHGLSPLEAGLRTAPSASAIGHGILTQVPAGGGPALPAISSATPQLAGALGAAPRAERRAEAPLFTRLPSAAFGTMG
ncbi:hypothetical protein [Planobispora longispora]|uniref:Uncharacterized protein n=1 Tax=Planobispora longispora TaxID=28887 RepID=A0A8J3W6C2_9ACTN|nr:hypothetical protein [Planobispora longispora]BFE87784.1 hypothetical protein GCM10020093_103850 [Planobispora longispora]GIH77687.1 hypothetical protein Plo01_41160 [Planobispora longispora]